MRYVEANPEAPKNEPDRSEQYSFRAQQAADESPLSDSSNLPKVDGEEESMKIVQGELQQAEPVPPGVYSPNARPGEGEGTEGGGCHVSFENLRGSLVKRRCRLRYEDSHTSK